MTLAIILYTIGVAGTYTSEPVTDWTDHASAWGWPAVCVLSITRWAWGKFSG